MIKMTINPGRFNGHLPEVAIDKRKINRIEKAADFAKTEKAAAVNPSAGPDQVILSSRAQELQQIKKTLQTLSDVRETKVQGIEAQLKDGSYNADSGKIADKLIKEFKINELA
jgi:negative regulator of flagellin synthesis FlgM